MKKRDRDPQDGLPPAEESTEEEVPELPAAPRVTSRRNLLKGGAAAFAASSLFSLLKPGALKAQLAAGDELPDGEEPLDVKYDLDRFEANDAPEGPELVEGEDLEITAGDFTRGMSAIVGSLKYLDPGLKAGLTGSLAKIEAQSASGDAEGAMMELDAFRLQVITNADVIDAAAGSFAFGEVTSFTQTIIVLVDFLISLRTRIVGVIWIFPWGQIWKIIEVFKRYTVCLTVVQVITFTLYLRLFLFILVVRFRFFPGLRISIDILLLFITICIRVRIVRVFRICLTYTRKYLLLVRC